MAQAAIYAGSFDPWTQGHSYVLHSAAKIFDEIHIVLGSNPAKKNILDSRTRKQIIFETLVPSEFQAFKNLCQDLESESPYEQKNVEFQIQNTTVHVTESAGLIAEYAAQHGIEYFVRGLRNAMDYEVENQLAQCNFALNPKIQTFAVFCPPYLAHISSSFARQVMGSSYQTGTSYLSQAHMIGRQNASRNSESAEVLSNRLFLGRLFDFLCHGLERDMAGKECQINLTEVPKIFSQMMERNTVDARTSVVQFLNATLPNWVHQQQSSSGLMLALFDYILSEQKNMTGVTQ